MKQDQQINKRRPPSKLAYRQYKRHVNTQPLNEKRIRGSQPTYISRQIEKIENEQEQSATQQDCHTASALHRIIIYRAKAQALITEGGAMQSNRVPCLHSLHQCSKCERVFQMRHCRAPSNGLWGSVRANWGDEVFAPKKGPNVKKKEWKVWNWNPITLWKLKAFQRLSRVVKKKNKRSSQSNYVAHLMHSFANTGECCWHPC